MMPTKLSPIRRLRLAEGLTQLDLARRTRLSPTMISLAERGLVELNDDQRARLAQALSVTPSILEELQRIAS